MYHQTVVSVKEVALNLDDPNWIIIDCRFSLRDKEQGLKNYLEEHVHGAFYADLEKELSGPIIPGETGRHPLPHPDSFLKVAARWGVTNQSQMVVYDDAGGAFAARLWWMFRWIGHPSVALMDGGWQAWTASKLPTKGGYELPKFGDFRPQIDTSTLADLPAVEKWISSPDHLIIDAREPERFRGEIEPIDPVAGRIPGAVSFPYRLNLDSEGYFKRPEELREAYSRLLDGTPPENAACYCGSGVTAALNLVGMVHAGLKSARLYVGSYSEWITDKNRPVIRGKG